VPWEKFKRATFIPARMSRSRVSGAREAGPMAHTIFVLGMAAILALREREAAVVSR
jgi:hypothetical protein